MRYLVVIFTLCVLAGCDNRKDPFYSNDVPPTVKLRTTSSSYADNISDTVKVGNTYTAYFKINYTYSYSTAPATTIQTTAGSVVGQISNDSLITLSGFSPGTNQVKITVKDVFGKSNSSLLTLTAMANQPPIAVYTITYDGNVTLSINAGASYDQDAKWGGALVNYGYTLDNNAEIQQSSPTIQFTINQPTPSTGVHIISVRVQDNNGAWSAPQRNETNYVYQQQQTIQVN